MSHRESSMKNGSTEHLDQSIDVSTWIQDDEYAPYPVGTREKALLFCPTNATLDHLIPGHQYLFKESRKRYPEQFWAEIIAY